MIVPLFQIEDPIVNVIDSIVYDSNVNQLMRLYVAHRVTPLLLVSIPLNLVIAEKLSII